MAKSERRDVGEFESLFRRRDLLRVGSLTIGAAALPEFGRARAGAEEASAGPAEMEAGGAAADSVIFLWMAGGVTHIDSFDPKIDAPQEVRGTLGDIGTAIPGVRFCETVPELARAADKLALVRSYSHDSNDHLLSQVYTLSGRKVDRASLFSEPNIGSIVAHRLGARNGLPGYIAVPGITRPGPPPHDFFRGGWLGGMYAPFCLGGIPTEPDFTVGDKQDDPPAKREEDWTPSSLHLSEQGLRQLGRRARLRQQLDLALRVLEKGETLASAEAKHRAALELLSSPQVRGAFALSEEPDAVREQYGRTKIGCRCLLARRLVEAGARYVMVDYGYDPDYGNVWDNHNAPSQRHPPIQQMVKRGYHLAGMDRAFAALINDLSQRGRLDRTLVVFLTEFGRTPKINPRGGRDHWGAAGSIFFAGGPVRPGQVIGATDRQGAAPTTRSYTPADIAATIYSALGVDFRGFIPDFQGRPRPVLENGGPIPIG